MATNGDGDRHLNDGLLIMRNMLPAASFHHAVQNTTTRHTRSPRRLLP